MKISYLLEKLSTRLPEFLASLFLLSAALKLYKAHCFQLLLIFSKINADLRYKQRIGLPQLLQSINSQLNHGSNIDSDIVLVF